MDAFRRYNDALDREASRLLQMTREGAAEKNYYVNAEHMRLQVQAPWYGPEFHRLCAQVDWNDIELS
jgi:4-hydroxyacetophenone monooxygenase